MVNHRRSAQSLSLDLLVAVMIFLSIIVIFYYLSHTKSSVEKSDYLHEQALKVSSLLSSEGIISSSREINLSSLEELYSMDPKEIQKLLSINSKFCIYVVDSEGNIIAINNKVGVGYSDINISGFPCGTNLSDENSPSPPNNNADLDR